MATLNKIVSRAPTAPGRLIPSSDDLPIHDGRRLDASVMFMDICKFSQRPAWTEPEQQTLLQILSLLFTEMIRIIEDHDGTVEKNTGDGLITYFVADKGNGITAQHRALAAALTMFSAKDRIINPLIVRSGLAGIDFRICLDYGPLTIAHVGASRGFRGVVAIGTTANIASKMLAIAERNEILIGNMFLPGIPKEWVDAWVSLKTVDSGWSYRQTNDPYPIWSYRGRWNEAL